MATIHSFRREFTLLVLMGGFNFFSFNLVQPILPGFAKTIGAQDTEIGLITAAFVLSSIFSRIYFAPVADRRGRKTSLLVGLLIYAVSPLLYIFAQTPLALIGVRLFHGIGMGATTTSITAMLTDMIPANKRGTMLGISMSARNIGSAVAPAVAGSSVLFAGFTSTFALTAIPAIASLTIFFFVSETLAKENRWKRSLSNQLSLMRDLSRSRGVIIPSIGILSQTITYGAIISFLPLFVAERLSLSFEEATFVVGISFTAYAASAAIFRVFGGRAIDMYGRKPIPILSLFGLFGVILFLSRVSTTNEVYLAMALYGLVFSSISPALTAMLADSVKPEERATALSVYMSMFE
ncbi:MAG: MFS transporter, partial [Nitrososphaerales archaeon]